jgi:hypothetical protein
VIWVYAICDRPELPPPPPLDSVREGELLAVVSRGGSTGDPTPDALWAHERVIERLMIDRTVLPMRFGSKVAGDEELREFMNARRDELTAALARVAGRVELGLRVAQHAAVPVGASGRDYVMAKLHEGREADALHDPLAALAVEARLQPARGGDELLRAAYLVDRREVPRFRATVERLQSAHPDAAILCTGPWPPYSFMPR